MIFLYLIITYSIILNDKKSEECFIKCIKLYLKYLGMIV